MDRRKMIYSGILGGASIFYVPNLLALPVTTKPSLDPFSIPPSAPLNPGPTGVDIKVIIHSGQTNMQLSNIEVALDPKKMGPPPHVHDELDELMYVLEGTATVMIGKEIYEVLTGGWLFRPHGIAHSFWNSHDTKLRFIDFFFNQNIEDYLEEIIHKIPAYIKEKNISRDAPEIAQRIAELDKKFGITWYPEQLQGIVEKYGLTV